MVRQRTKSATRYLRLQPYVSKVAALAGRRYACGPHAQDALKIASELHEKGYHSTVAYWNRPGESHETIIRSNCEVLCQATTSCNYLSVKAPALNALPEVFELIFESAAASQAAIHFDSHAIEQTEATIALVKRALTHTPHVGLTFPSRWQRSAADLADLSSMGVIPRLVKGQWKDPDHPNFDPIKGFFTLAEVAAERARPLRIATHDAELLKQVLDYLEKSSSLIEIEVLYGLPAAQIINIARERNLPVRVYLPFGVGFLPYAISQLTRQPSLAWRLLSDLTKTPLSVRFPDLTKSD